MANSFDFQIRPTLRPERYPDFELRVADVLPSAK